MEVRVIPLLRGGFPVARFSSKSKLRYLILTLVCISVLAIAIPKDRAQLAFATLGCPAPEGWLSTDFQISLPFLPRDLCARTMRARYRLAARLETAAERDPSAPVLRHLGTLHLYHQKTQKALEVLEKAAESQPHEPENWNDLAVAYLAASRNDQPLLVIRAASAALRAIHLDPELPEARYNYALALESFYPGPLTVEAWEELKKLDNSSEWAEEADRHLERLKKPTEAQAWQETRPRWEAALKVGNRQEIQRLAERFPQVARQALENKLLPEWGDLAYQGRQREADDKLQLARWIAQSLLHHNQDRMGVETIGAIDRAATSPARLKQLAAAHRDLGREADLIKLTALSETFRTVGSPFKGWAVYRLARSHYAAYNYDQALRLLSPLISPETAKDFPSLTAKSLRLAALTNFVEGNLSLSLTHYQKAERIYLQTGDAESLAAIRSLISETLRFSGDTERSWNYLFASLAQARQLHTAREAQIILEEAVESLIAQGEPSLALLFENEVLDHWVEPGEALTRSAALQRRAQIYLRLGDRKRAVTDVHAAIATAADIEHPGDRQSQIGDLHVALGQIQAGKDWAQAANSFTEAIHLYMETSYNQALPDLFFKRALAYAAQGHDDRAERDLQLAALEIERQRGTLSDTALRTTFLDGSRALFDRWVQIAVEQGDSARAFDHAERGRARTLLDTLAGHSTSSATAEALSLLEIQSRIPPKTALVVYRVLPDRWMAWVAYSDRHEFREVRTSEVILSEQVSRFRDSVARRRGAGLPAVSKELYREIVRPLEAWIRDASTLIVIPDGALHRLPFGSLLNPKSGRYLIEDHAVAKVPSASVYVAALQKSEQKRSQGPLTALSVGDPAFDPTRFLMHRLKAARKQAEHAAAAFPGSELLVGEAATQDAFLTRAGRHRLVLFAGHTVENFKAPWKSGLLFAPSGSDIDDGILTAEEIEGASFEATSLVILGACSTADGKVTASEGLMSLARPFLLAGVPAVVGTLWDVEDEQTAPLLMNLQERLRKGESPLLALQETQVESLKSGNRSLQAWAAFELIGGIA